MVVRCLALGKEAQNIRDAYHKGSSPAVDIRLTIILKRNPTKYTLFLVQSLLPKRVSMADAAVGLSYAEWKERKNLEEYTQTTRFMGVICHFRY